MIAPASSPAPVPPFIVGETNVRANAAALPSAAVGKTSGAGETGDAAQPAQTARPGGIGQPAPPTRFAAMLLAQKHVTNVATGAIAPPPGKPLPDDDADEGHPDDGATNDGDGDGGVTPASVSLDQAITTPPPTLATPLGATGPSLPPAASQRDTADPQSDDATLRSHGAVGQVRRRSVTAIALGRTMDAARATDAPIADQSAPTTTIGDAHPNVGVVGHLPHDATVTATTARSRDRGVPPSGDRPPQARTVISPAANRQEAVAVRQTADGSPEVDVLSPLAPATPPASSFAGPASGSALPQTPAQSTLPPVSPHSPSTPVPVLTPARPDTTGVPRRADAVGGARPRPAGRTGDAAKAPDSAAGQSPSPSPREPLIGGDLAPLITPREQGSVTPAPPASQSGHDFTAIVDRLVEARQAGAAINTGVTIAHGEFGHVRLRITGRDGDISIALSSPDPGFAPIAQAAIQATPIAAAPAGDPPPPSTTMAGGSANTRSSHQDATASTPRDARPTPGDRATANGRTTQPGPGAKAAASSAKPAGGIYA